MILFFMLWGFQRTPTGTATAFNQAGALRHEQLRHWGCDARRKFDFMEIDLWTYVLGCSHVTVGETS